MAEEGCMVDAKFFNLDVENFLTAGKFKIVEANFDSMNVEGQVTIKQGITVDQDTFVVNSSNDRVGIALSNPQYTLDVNGDINISSGSTLRIGGTEAVFSNWSIDGSDIYRNSNVGIGTSNPQNLLHLEGTTSPQIKIGYNSTNFSTISVDANSNTTFATAENGVFNFSDNVNVNAGLDISGGPLTINNQAITQTNGGNVTFSGPVHITNNIPTTSSTTGALKVNGGISTQGDLIVGEDLSLRSDGSSLYFGQNNSASIIHDGQSGLSVSSNLVVSGNLTVNGTTTTIDTQNFKVEDPIMILGKNNDETDTVDIGFYGKYNNSGVKYAGMFRDQSDNEKFKLFKDLTVEPTTTVDTSASGYTAATLVVDTLEGNVTGNVTGDVTGDVTGQVSDISNHNTDALTEGSTNKYFSESLSRDAISVTDNGGDGSLSYDSSTGQISYTGPSATDTRSHFSGGTGVSLDSSGEISIGQQVGIDDDVTFNSLNVVGDTVIGEDSTDTMIVNSETRFLNTVNFGTGTITINTNDETAGGNFIDIQGKRLHSTHAETLRQIKDITNVNDNEGKILKIGSQGVIIADDHGIVNKHIEGDLIIGEDSTDSMIVNSETRFLNDVNVEGNITGNVTGNITGNVTGDVTGNAATATALETSRTIGGVSFDGTANINLPGVNTTGDQDTTGNAATVTNGIYTTDKLSALSSTTSTELAGVISDETGTGSLVFANTPTLVSPSLTGTPSAPTASSTTNTTQIATTEFVQTRIGEIIDTAPAALDTLNELAAAINDDANFASTVTTSLGTKLDINASSFGGNAATATALETARTIGGVSFDGTANINLPGVNAEGNQDTTGNAATATALETARTIGGVSFDGTANINLPGVNAEGNQDTTGNAATATALETARTIGGVSFDGTANINLPGVNAEGNQDTTGNAATATALETARTIGGVSFDGSADITPANITVADTTDTTCSVALFESATGDLAPKNTDGGLTYNAGTGQLTSTSILSNNIMESYDGNPITYIVTVANKTSNHLYNGSGSSSGYLIDGIESPYIEFVPGKTYKFDQSDGSNSGHPLRFYYDKDKNSGEYTTDVTTNGTPGSSGAYTQIVVITSTPITLFYQCSAHSLMGNQVQVKGGIVPISKGGTGATSAAAARTALGVDAAGTDNSTNVTLTNQDYLSISGQAITAGTVPISKGGTGLTSLGQAGQVLTVNSNANALEWANSSSGTVTETFKTITVSGGNSVEADTATDTLTLTAGTGMTITADSANDTITFSSSGGGTASNSFETIAVSGQNSVVADSATDTLTLAAGTGMTITTDNSTDTITFSSSGGSTLTVQDEGTDLSTAATTLNFVGSGVSASGSGSTKTITINGGGGGGGGTSVTAHTDTQTGNEDYLSALTVDGTKYKIGTSVSQISYSDSSKLLLSYPFAVAANATDAQTNYGSLTPSTSTFSSSSGLSFTQNIGFTNDKTVHVPIQFVLSSAYTGNSTIYYRFRTHALYPSGQWPHVIKLQYSTSDRLKTYFGNTSSLGDFFDVLTDTGNNNAGSTFAYTNIQANRWYDVFASIDNNSKIVKVYTNTDEYNHLSIRSWSGMGAEILEYDKITLLSHDSNTTYQFDGDLSHLFIFNSALSVSEAQRWMNYVHADYTNPAAAPLKFLADVSDTAPSDGQALVYDTSSSQWQPEQLVAH